MHVAGQCWRMRRIRRRRRPRISLPAGRLARTQDDRDRMAGGGVIDVDRQKTTFIVMRIEQRKLLMAVSDTAVSRGVRIAWSTVKGYLERAASSGLSWEVAAVLNEEELDRRLFAAADTRHLDRPLPDWEAVEKELRGRGVTLRLLWLAYWAGIRKATATPGSAGISTPGSDAPGRP